MTKRFKGSEIFFDQRGVALAKVRCWLLESFYMTRGLQRE